jgi:hypothetical protein
LRTAPGRAYRKGMSAPFTPQCDAVRAALVDGAFTAQLRAHAQACPHCHSVMAAHGALGRLVTGVTAPAEALRRAHSRARAELRARPRVRRWWWSALGLVGLNVAVGIGSAVMMLDLRASTHRPYATPTPMLWAIALLLLALLTAGPLISFSPSPRGGLGAGLALALAAAVAVGFGGSGAPNLHPFFAIPGMACMSAEVLMSLLPLGVVLWLLTWMPARPLRTLLATLSAAAAGLLGLHLSCPVGTVTHLLGFHVLPWLALGGLAVLVRSRLRTRTYAV